MKRVFAVLVWLLVLVTVCGCSAEQPAGKRVTEPAAVQNSLPEQAEAATETAAEEPALPQESQALVPDAAAEPEQRINPPEDMILEDITPFGNIPGTIVTIAPDLEKMNFGQIGEVEYDAHYKRLLFEGEHFAYQIHVDHGRPVYVVDGYIQKAEKLYAAVEQVTGLSFVGRTTKLERSESKITLFMGILSGGENPESDYSTNGFDAQGHAIYASQASAFLGKNADLIANLAGILQTDYAYNRFNGVYTGGFCNYTAYKVQKYLEEHDPELAMASQDSADVLMNYHIHGGLQELMEKPMDHWIEHPDSLWDVIIGNGPSSVGFYFMMYLDEVYGDYCGWIPAYGQNYPCYYGNETRDIPNQIQNMKDVYGEDVFEGFYPWLEEKLNSSFVVWTDYSWRKQYVFYPLFAVYGYEPVMFSGTYEDMCISLAEYRNYMAEFKGYALDTLTLVNDAEAQVALYGPEGEFLMVTKGTPTAQGEYRICLEDVSYIKYIGTGTVTAKLVLQ